MQPAARQQALDDWQRLFDAARVLVQTNYPTTLVGNIKIELADGREIRLPASIRCSVFTGNPLQIHRPDKPRHSSDFRTINWYGTKFKFTATQAAVVRELWAAKKNDTPDVSQARLLEAAGSDGRRLDDLFRRSPAWGVMIVQGEMGGTYRLGDEPEV
jgi:hypothetical protein